MQTVSVALFGCGLIGSQWDMQRGAGAPALTHARVFSEHPGSRIVAFCDTDRAKAEAASQRWGGGTVYVDPVVLFAGQAVDLVVVASASSARASVIEPALAAGVRTLVIEKPLATTLDESRRLVQATDAAGARTLVNYLRHWDPAMQLLGRQLRAGEFGKPQRLVGHYGKGLANCGSHMIDLAGTLLGARPLRARSLGSPLPAAESDWSSGADPTLDAQIDLLDASGRCVRLDMIGTDQRDHTCWELRLIGSTALVELTQGGRSIQRYPVVDDPDYPRYRIPGAGLALPSQALASMARMADEAVALAGGQLMQSRCDAHDALRTALTVDAVRRSQSQSGAWMAIEAFR